MTNLTEVLSIVEGAIGIVRNNPDPDEPTPSDSYLAYAIMNELRRAGLKLVPKDEPGPDILETTQAVAIPGKGAEVQQPDVYCCENMAQFAAGFDGFGYPKSRHIEHRQETGHYIIADASGEFYVAIRYCPWCGTELPERVGFPSLDPGNELVLPDEPSITEECVATLRSVYPDLMERVTLGRPLRTRGLTLDWIWRVDYEDPHSKSRGSVNRFMCFKNDRGQMNVAVAPGHALKPLQDQGEPTLD